MPERFVRRGADLVRRQVVWVHELIVVVGRRAPPFSVVKHQLNARTFEICRVSRCFTLMLGAAPLLSA